jgi:hypothetical protein
VRAPPHSTAYIELKTLLFDVEASLWLSEPRHLILLSFCTQSLLVLLCRDVYIFPLSLSALLWDFLSKIATPELGSTCHSVTIMTLIIDLPGCILQHFESMYSIFQACLSLQNLWSVLKATWAPLIHLQFVCAFDNVFSFWDPYYHVTCKGSNRMCA